ncbi:MAG: hypothetical protein IJW87_00005, partial [Clostridia bacterium]|nr:hypothetical protein [Clostridia bacterium]
KVSPRRYLFCWSAAPNLGQSSALHPPKGLTPLGSHGEGVIHPALHHTALRKRSDKVPPRFLLLFYLTLASGSTSLFQKERGTHEDHDLKNFFISFSQKESPTHRIKKLRINIL